MNKPNDYVLSDHEIAQWLHDYIDALDQEGLAELYTWCARAHCEPLEKGLYCVTSQPS